MQKWFSHLKNIKEKIEELPEKKTIIMLKAVLKQGWPLLCIPLVVYGRRILEPFIGFEWAYGVICIFPGIVTLISHKLYKEGKSPLAPYIMSILCSLYFGSLFTYSVAFVEVFPILPKNIFEVLTFVEKLKIQWLLIASSSLLLSSLSLLHLVKDRLTPRTKVKQENSHGSARFATRKEIKYINEKHGIPLGCLLKEDAPQDIDALKKVIQTRASHDIVRQNPHHMVVVAPSGAGKGIGIVIPTLLEYEGPVLVTDVKEAENFHVTARHRQSLGRETYILDPFNNTGHISGCINILDFLEPNSKEIVDDAIMVSALLIKMPQGFDTVETYFVEQARNVLQALILYVVCSDIFSKNKKNLFEVYKLACKTPQDFEEMMIDISETSELAYGVPARRAAALLSTKEGELSATLNTINKELRFMDSPLVQEITSHTTIDLVKLVHNKADLYLCIPVEKLEAYGRLIRLIVSMTFVIAQRQKSHLKKPLLMVLDEMALLGSLPKVEEALIVGRGYKVKILGIIQTTELLKAISPQKWKTFLSNNLLVFFGLNELEDCEYLSKLLGQTTIESFAISKGESQQKGEVKASSTSENQGESQSYQGRAILTSDEIRFLDETAVFAFRKGLRPMLLKRIEYYKHPAWKGKFDPNPLEQ